MPSCFPFFAGVTVFLVTGIASAHAQTALELTDRARKELQAYDDSKNEEIKKAEEERKKNPAAANASGVMAAHQEEFALNHALGVLQNVRDDLVSGDNNNALLALGNVTSIGTFPTEVRPILDALNQRIHAEQTEKISAYTKDVDTTCQRAAAAVLQAKEAKDLDDSLKDLKRVSELPAPTNQSSAERNFAAQLRYAITFVTRWQDYLIARSRDDDNQVRTILRNLTMETNVPLISRSEILARIPQTESERETTIRARREDKSRSQSQIDADARGIVQGLQKLDDVAPALVKLVDLQTEDSQSGRNYRSDSILNATVQGLDVLQKSILEYRNGLTPDINGLLSRTEYASHPEINLALWSLRMQLVREAASHLMGIPDEEKPGADEPVGVYLHRLIEFAKARQDWSAVTAGMHILQALSASNGNSYGIDSEQNPSAYQLLLTADNLEKAGQYGEAVATYLSALHTSQKDLPAAWIGQHLEVIQKAHPEEYALGQGRSSDDARTSYMEMLRAYQSMYGTPGNGPQSPAPAPPPPSPSASTVPAPTATPSPAATVVATPTP